MSGTRRKGRPECPGKPYASIPIDVLQSTAFIGAGHTAKALLFELMRQHDGYNNGRLELSFVYLKKYREWTSRDVVTRARNELIERGLIIQTKKGGLNAGTNYYAVTWLDISNFKDLEISPLSYHKGAYAMMDKLPKNNKSSVPRDGTGSTVSRYSSVP